MEHNTQSSSSSLPAEPARGEHTSLRALLESISPPDMPALCRFIEPSLNDLLKSNSTDGPNPQLSFQIQHKVSGIFERFFPTGHPDPVSFESNAESALDNALVDELARVAQEQQESSGLSNSLENSWFYYSAITEAACRGRLGCLTQLLDCFFDTSSLEGVPFQRWEAQAKQPTDSSSNSAEASLNERTLLEHAAYHGHLDCFEYLINDKYDLAEWDLTNVESLISNFSKTSSHVPMTPHKIRPWVSVEGDKKLPYPNREYRYGEEQAKCRHYLKKHSQFHPIIKAHLAWQEQTSTPTPTRPVILNKLLQYRPSTDTRATSTATELARNQLSSATQYQPLTSHVIKFP